jgi:hypothetical protein
MTRPEPKRKRTVAHACQVPRLQRNVLTAQDPFHGHKGNYVQLTKRRLIDSPNGVDSMQVVLSTCMVARRKTYGEGKPISHQAPRQEHTTESPIPIHKRVDGDHFVKQPCGTACDGVLGAHRSAVVLLNTCLNKSSHGGFDRLRHASSADE